MGFTAAMSSVGKAESVQAAKKDFVKCLDNSICPICGGLLFTNFMTYECQDNKDHRFYKDILNKVSIIGKDGRKCLFEFAHVADNKSISKMLGYEI